MDEYEWRCPHCEGNAYHCICETYELQLTKKESGLLYLAAAGRDWTELETWGWTNRIEVLKAAHNKVFGQQEY